MRRVLVFCGSSTGSRPEYAAAGRAFGTLLAQRGLGVVYGGASIGLMGAVADAALAAGGEVVGVIPRHLADYEEVPHGGLTELRVVGSMHERKALMAELSDAVAVLPGGIGTLDELFEMFTWSQLGLHTKPIGLLDTAAYWQPLLAALDHVVAEGFLREAHRETLLVAQDAEELLVALASYRAPATTPAQPERA